jgi:hypothetical protein
VRVVVLTVMLVCAMVTGLPAASASATDGTQRFVGSCAFDATDEFAQPFLPSQIVPGTLRGSGTCTGSLVDASGKRHDLRSAPARVLARRAGPGGCLGATNAGTATLTLPYGQIDATLTETFVGAFGTDRLTGIAGGTATMLLALVDRYDEVARHCADASPQRPHFVVHLTTPGISG